MVTEANRILNENRYAFEDRASIEKSLEIFLIYQEFYNPERDFEKAARIWNGGPRALELGISIGYWEDIQKLMENPKDELLAEVLINSANIQAV